jgi:hypothetical protein
MATRGKGVKKIPNPEAPLGPTAVSPGWCGCWWWSATIEQAVQHVKQIPPPTEAQVQAIWPGGCNGAGWCWLGSE